MLNKVLKSTWAPIMFKHTQKIGFDTLSSYFGKFAFRVNILYLVLTEDQTFPRAQVIAK